MKTSTPQPKLQDLQSRLGLKFKDRTLLENAFIHRSFLNEHKNFKGTSNERLEFLGDSILSLVVSDFLFSKLPKSTEGTLTQTRAALVRTETLAKVAKTLSLGQYLYLAKGEEESGGRQNDSILANCLESLIGAIYLDLGLSVVKEFIGKTILANWKVLAQSAVSDYKSRLQEYLQRQYHQSPSYKLITSWGPDHSRKFQIGVYLGTKLLGKGSGKNKQVAAQNAARDALTRLKEGSLG